MSEGVTVGRSRTDELVQASVDTIGSGIAILDGDGMVTVINKMWRDFGPTSGCVGGTARVGESYTGACLSGPTDVSVHARRIVEDVRNVLAGDAEIATVEYECRREDELRCFQSRVERIAGYQPTRILVTQEDVTAIYDLRSASASRIASSLEIAVMGVDPAGFIRTANEAAGHLFGLPAEMLRGRPLGGLVTSYDSQAGADAGWWLQADDNSSGSAGAPVVVRVLRNDGGEFAGEARRLLLPGVEPSLTGVVIRDLTDRRRLATMLEFNAFRDALTGLPNRTLLFDHLRADLDRSLSRHTMLAAFYIEIEQIGEAGAADAAGRRDWVDKKVAARLRNSVRAGDTIARIASGRFAVIVPGLQEIGDACFAAQRLSKTLTQPIPCGDDIVEISAGIGAAIYPWDSRDAGSLLDRAREALHITRTGIEHSVVGGSEIFRDLFHTLGATDTES